MAVTYLDIQALASEFANLSQIRIDPFIARAQRRVNATFWGDLADDGVTYLAAHLLALAQPPSDKVGGGITSETAGPVSRSRAAPTRTGIPSEYAGSTWGCEYYAMLKSLRYQSVQAV
jgi:hypothetical protein